MSSEKLSSAKSLLKGNLGGSWDILDGSAGNYTDLGIARRFGGSAAAYSLRDIGAMNGRVVRVRRSSDSAEEDFSANQVQSGALETWVGSGNDGFVAKLYDQSGNGDDMSQTDTGKQPLIVDAGVQVKLENGKPAFKGDGIDDFLEASYFYSAGEVTAMSTFSVLSNRADVGDESTIISAGSGVSTNYTGFVTSLDKTANGNPFEQRVANASGKKETSLVQQALDGDILGSTFFTKDGTHLIKATTEDGTNSTSAAITVGAFNSGSTSGKLRIGCTRTFTLQRFFNYTIAETMVFRADLRDEGIEDEINQFYNIG